MSRKSQANPSRSKSTPSKSPSATSSATRRSATAKKTLDTTTSEVNASPQSHLAHAVEEPNTKLTAQQLPAQSSELANGMGELQQQLAALEAQFAQAQSNYTALQQTSLDQAKAIDTLRGQLEQQHQEAAAKQEQHNALQQKTIAQAQIIENLREQISVLDQQLQQHSSESRNLQADANSGLSSSIPVDSIDVNNVHRQVTTLRAEFDQQVMQQMTQQQRYAILQRQCDEQAQVIAELRNLVMQEQRHAAIGESYLNKWRYRTFRDL